MSLENKKPSYKARLNGKILIKYTVGLLFGVAAVAGGAYVIMGSSDKNVEKPIDYTNKLNYDKNGQNGEEKIKSLVGVKSSASDPYASVVDPNLATVISGQNQDGGANNPNSQKYVPLYSSDDRLAYKDNFDYDHATDAQIRSKVQEEEGKKIIKVGSYARTGDDNSSDWRSNQSKNNIIGSDFSQNPTLYDASGKKILGYDRQGNPIVGYDKQGNPILGSKLPNGVAGYDLNGNPIMKSSLLLDSNGNPILSYDSNGNPIIGYDALGKPVLGNSLPSGVAGYDINGKPISKSSLSQGQGNNGFANSGNSGVTNFPLIFDSNGKQILGYDSNGNPIVGYDVNGKPILGAKLQDGIMGYDINHKPISKADFAKNLSFNPQNGKSNIFDKNGKLIVGYDKQGNPIVGYDANGKPILGIVESGVDGYDENSKPISNLKDKLYKSSGIKLTDKDGKQIIGYDSNGNPIVGYDSNGNPIIGKVDKGIAGYDSNGKPISNSQLKSMAIQKALLANLNTPLLDKNGNPIVGFDGSGNPIIGYDKQGRPILGKVDKGVAGYDSNGKPIMKSELQQYLQNNAVDKVLQKSAKPSLYDKSGNLIIGYDKQGNPIIGYQSNGQAILGKVDKGVAGYDSNGNPILRSKLQDFYNGNSNNFSSAAGVAGAGMFGNGNNGTVPPLSGFQAGNQNVSIRPQSTGVNISQMQSNTRFNKQKESNPWDDALAKSQVEADKAGLDIGLNYKNPESSSQQQNGQSNSDSSVSQPLLANNGSNNNVDNKQRASDVEKPSITSPVKVYNKYTLKAGAFIPMIMQTGINSDLPGAIEGRVSQNVYDTATGKYLLIPQGAILRGSYSSNITYGQERVMIAWNSLVYPDASEVKLSANPGTDLGGYSGMNDQVNNHYWSLFGNTFILSAITAGLEYNQSGSQNSANNGSSFNSSLSNSSGQMMGQAAAGVIQKALNISPTLIIRNGFRGNVFLTQDLSLSSPYVVKIYGRNFDN